MTRWRDYHLPAVVIARAALARGPLKLHRVRNGSCGIKWRYRMRLFNPQTINALIATGEAVRVGNEVRICHE